MKEDKNNSIFEEAGAATVPLTKEDAYEFNAHEFYVEKDKRYNIDMKQPCVSIAFLMTEGHPGAFIAASEIMSTNDEATSRRIFGILDDMNIRGIQLAYVFHVFCAGFVKELCCSVEDHERAMIDSVNNQKACPTKWFAVHSGATKDRMTHEQAFFGKKPKE